MVERRLSTCQALTTSTIIETECELECNVTWHSVAARSEIPTPVCKFEEDAAFLSDGPIYL